MRHGLLCQKSSPPDARTQTARSKKLNMSRMGWDSATVKSDQSSMAIASVCLRNSRDNKFSWSNFMVSNACLRKPARGLRALAYAVGGRAYRAAKDQTRSPTMDHDNETTRNIV